MAELTDLVSVLKNAVGTAQIGVGVTLPGEVAIAAGFAYAEKVRETMDPVLRNRLDAVMVQSIEDVHKLWRKLWVDAGLLG